jgi:predicted dehydrogenase
MDRPLRWGSCRPPSIGRKVIPGIAGAANCEVVAIASRDLARPRRAATELGIPRAHGSYEALLADPRSTRSTSRCPTTSTPLDARRGRAGKHVLCEKPLAMTVADALRMVEAARAPGCV